MRQSFCVVFLSTPTVLMEALKGDIDVCKELEIVSLADSIVLEQDLSMLHRVEEVE